MVELTDRERLERLAVAVSELNRRETIREHSTPGGLYRFIKYFWEVLEPQTKFVDGWVIQAICLHLEAVTDGRLKRLAINVPPGSSKSLIVNVFWPAWEWGPKQLGHMRYVSFSYGAWLTERDNAKFRDLVSSRKFQRLYGGTEGVKLTEAGKIKIGNTKTGWKFASSVGGVGTGERGHRILCFPAGTMVNTATGPVDIAELVRNRRTELVYSLNRNGIVELRPVTNWFENPASNLVRVNLTNGDWFRCTPNHEFLTTDGYRRADELHPGISLATIEPRKTIDQRKSGLAATDPVHLHNSDSVPSGEHGRFLVGKVDRPELIVAQRQWVLCSNPGLPNRTGGVTPRKATADVKYDCSRHAVSASNLRKAAFRNSDFARYRGGDAGLRAHLFDAKRPVFASILDILRPSAVTQVLKSAVSGVAITVSDFLAFWTWTNKGFHDQAVAHTIGRRPVDPKSNPRVTVAGSPSHYLALDGKRAPTPHGSSWEASYPPTRRNVVNSLGPDHGSPSFVVVDQVVSDGHADITYCIEVETNHNFSIAESRVVCGNCDDPHNVSDGESDLIRRETVRWFRESMSNRLNDMQQDAIVIIMQRVHDEDVCGTILDDGLPYEFLVIPMEYEAGRHCSTSIGWSDPRSADGELAWPERFPDQVVESLKSTLGPYAYSGQYQQSPEPRGGGIFKRDWWVPHEVPLGTSLKLAFQYVVASLDTAYTTKEENDPSAMTVWGVFEDAKGQPKILLLNAWEKRLEIHGAEVVRYIGEKTEEYTKRAQPHWGLVEWVVYTCRRFKVDRLIIESKAAGHSVAQEVRRLTASHEWAVELKDPKGEGDKVSRAYAVQHLFAEKMVCAPCEIDEHDNVLWRQFAEMVISQSAKFPKGHDDLVDTMTQALRHLRQIGLAVRREERQAIQEAEMAYPEKSGPLYPG